MIRIFHIDSSFLRDERLYERLLRQCSALRREKIAAIRHEEERRNRLAASLLLDLALRPMGLRERDARYAFSAAGKPRIADLPEFHFSISHSGSSVICAVSERPVGADLQLPRPVSRRLMSRMFTERELSGSDPIRLWTLKESYGKLTGEGIAVLERTELIFGNEIGILRDGVRQQVCFGEMSLNNGAFLATCSYENPSLSIEMIEGNRSDLF